MTLFYIAYAISYNDLGLFENIKSPDPKMHAKLNSKTHF